MSFFIKFIKIGIILSIFLIINSITHSIKNGLHKKIITSFFIMFMLIGIYTAELLLFKTLPTKMQFLKPLIASYILKTLIDYEI